jgi:hypothetical protein
MRGGRVTAVAAVRVQGARLLACLAVCCASTVAGAEDSTYPQTQVDRPLLMYGGMTSLDVSEDIYTYTQSGMDVNGHPTSTTKYNNTLDLVVGHSFGLVEISGRVVGAAAIASASGQMGCEATMYGSLESDLPQTTYRYAYSEGIGYSRRLLRLDHRLALFAGASAYLLEESLTPSNAPASAGTLLGAHAGASVTVQVAPRLAFQTGAGVGGTIAKTSSLADERPVAFGPFAQLQQTVFRWDFYANFSLIDVTRSARPYFSAGFVHRWGA